MGVMNRPNELKGHVGVGEGGGDGGKEFLILSVIQFNKKIVFDY